MYLDTDSSPDRGCMVQVDAFSANVALARPLRVPDLRAAAPGMLGGAFAGRAARAGATAPGAGPERLDGGDGIEDLISVITALVVLLLPSLVLSIVPCPGAGAARTRS